MNRFLSVVFVLVLTWALLSQAAPARAAQGVDAAMQGFFEAMINKDSNALLAFFPQQSNFKLIPYVIGSNTPEKIGNVSYSRVKNDFSNKKGLYVFFFEKPNGWTYNVEFRRGEPWKKRSGNVFTAPESSMGHTYLKWKQEGDNWVIDELAYVHP
jgi:hypothetical protein